MTVLTVTTTSDEEPVVGRIFLQGYWADSERYIEWSNFYDISTPEKVNKIGVAAFELYLKRIYGTEQGIQYPSKEYTLEMYKKDFIWRGGEVRNNNNPANKSAWAAFDRFKAGYEEVAVKLYAAIESYNNKDGEALLQFLNGLDNVNLTFRIKTLTAEFDTDPYNESQNDDDDDDVIVC